MASKVRSLLITFIPFFLLSWSTLAQTGTFTGQVTDSTQSVLLTSCNREGTDATCG